jgi:uncharacterized membrane protein (DUF2068 family)
MVIAGISILVNGFVSPSSTLPIHIILGIAWFVLAWGLWTGKGWAWIITLILAVISAVFNVIEIITLNVGSVFSLIVNIIIIYYLYRPNVRAYFGRSTGISK